jgi:4-amino-4-deoxy-L-arabinose transferase-like glycosyltransferase
MFRTSNIHLVPLLVLCGVLFFYRLADRDLTSSHEARAAQDAQTMLTSGDWGLPRLYDGKPELQKPPLYYWLVAAIARAAGGPVDAWAVRLPAACAALLTVLVVYALGRLHGGASLGLLAAAILATCLHFTWLARVGRIDMPLTLTVTLTLVGFYRGRQGLLTDLGRGAWRWFLLSYLGVVVGLLLKGPIAAVLPAVVVAGYFVVERRRTESGADAALLHFVHRHGLWWGVPLVLSLALPWFFWANGRTNGEFFRVFFWYHNVQRGLGGSEVLPVHPWWFYTPRLAVDLLPWSLLLPAACWSMWQHRLWSRDPLLRFTVVWLLAMVGLLSCMRFKRADYLLPAYPGAALLLACVLHHVVNKQPGRWAAAFHSSAMNWAPGAMILVVAGCVLGWWAYVDWVEPHQEQERTYRSFAAAIRHQTPDMILFFRAEAHPLAFHVGQPLSSLLEWENLDWWVARSPSTYVVMPVECLAQSHHFLTRGRLEEVVRSTNLGPARGERALVLVRTRRNP